MALKLKQLVRKAVGKARGVIKRGMHFIIRCFRFFVRIVYRKYKKIWAAHATKHIMVDVFELFMQQNAASGFNRYDVIVRHLAIEEYFGENGFGFDLYKRMQSERIRSVDSEQYVEKFRQLICSWSVGGYDKSSEIMLDKNLSLQDGSHRLACALYFGLDSISCAVLPYASKVEYGLEWFLTHGFTAEEVKILEDKRSEIAGSRGGDGISVILWPPAYKYAGEITEKLSLLFPVRNIRDMHMPEEIFVRFVRGVYHIDDIEDWKVEKKLEHMEGIEKDIRMMEIVVSVPEFRLKTSNNHTISQAGERVKRIFRTCYKEKVDNYFYDTIMHTGDNYVQSRYIKRLLEPAFSLRNCLQEIEGFEWIMVKEETDYLPDDFPDSYPFSKDMDIVCTEESLSQIADGILKFLGGNLRDTCSVKTIVEEKEKRERIRIEDQGFLIYQFDISCDIPGLRSEFLRNAVARKVRRGCYSVPQPGDELIFRICEYIRYPKKDWHLKYIKNHGELWDEEAIGVAFNKSMKPEIEKVYDILLRAQVF